MFCQRCNSTRILDFCGKTSDLFSCTFQGQSYDGYVPENIGINGTYGDYLEGELCLDCGQMQGEFPVSAKQLIEFIEGIEVID